LSARYSNSPSLRLAVARSSIYRGLHGLLCLFVVFSLIRVYQRGYPVLALTLLPLATLGCWRLAQQRLAGALICWSKGEWTIEAGENCVPVKLARSSTCLHGVIYLAWEQGVDTGRGSVFLFTDSAPAQDLRRLRVRITLER
jgi:hypothetical protein